MPRGRIRRYGGRAIKSVAVLVAVLLLTVFALILSLDTPLVRERVRALVHLPIDWKHTRLSLTSGLQLRGFSIANAAPFDAVAPNFLEVDRVDVSWALLQMLGSGPLTERVVISGVRVVVIVDAQGKTSLSALTAADAPPVPGAPIPPSTPLSQALEVLGDRLPIEHAVLRDATLRIVKLEMNAPPRELKASLDAEVALPKVNEIEAQLTVRLLEQALIDELPPVHELLRLDAAASFHPGEHRVLANLKSLRALDGALIGSTKVTFPDDGAPLVELAKLALDTTPVQATLDHQKSPLHLRGTLTVDAAQVRAGKLPVVEPGGKVELDVKLRSVALRLERLSIDGEALDVGVRLLAAPPHQAPMPAAPLGSAELGVKAGRFALSNGTFAIALHRVDMGAKVVGVDPYAASPLGIAQALHTQGKADRMELRPGPLSVIADSLSIRADVRMPGAEPGTLDLAIPIGAVSVSLSDKALIERQPAQLHVGVSGIRLDLDDLLRSQGIEQSSLSVGPLSLRSRLEKKATDSVNYDLVVDAKTLAPLAQLLTLPQNMSVPWPSMSAHAHTAGHIDGLRAVKDIRIAHKTRVEIVHPELRGPYAGRARKLTLAFSSQGSLRKHQGDLSVDAEDSAVGEYDLGTSRLLAKLGFDLGKPSFSLALSLAGERVPALSMEADATFGSSGKGLTWSLKTHGDKLGPVVRFLPRELAARHRLTWDGLSFDVAGHGVVRRAIDGFVGLRPRFAVDPLEAARGDGELTVDIRGLDYRDSIGETKATLGGFHAGISFHGEDGGGADTRPLRTARLALSIDHARVETGGHILGITDGKPQLELEARGAVRAPEVLARLDMTLGKLEQDYYPPYPVGGLSLGTTVRADTAGLFRVERFDLENRSSGSKVSLKGGVDLAPLRLAPLGPSAAKAGAVDDLLDDPHTPTAPQRLLGRVGLDVQLDLAQRLSGFPLADGVKADGVVTLPVHVQSADLRLFLVRGVLGLTDVNLKVGDGFEAKKVQGQIPVALELLVERRRKQDGSPDTKVRMVSHAEAVSFPRPRFAEHQPFLSERSFFSADQLRVRNSVLGPLAGNLAIDHTRLQLSQIEMQAAGGRVRGQLIADVAGLDTKISFRGDVTGIQPPSSKDKDDHLDANLALVIQPMRLQIDGRAELLHISRPLLLDLLDSWDPYHADLTANRARLALKFGYPKLVRLGFEQGFASMRLELGGLTRAVRIDEIKGVPMGPLVEHFLGAALRPLMLANGSLPTAAPAPSTESQEPSP